MASSHVEAAQAYVDALRTGVPALAVAAGNHLASNVVVQVGNQKFEGRDEAQRRITGVWPQTPVYRKGNWQSPQEQGDKVLVHASMPPFGAGVQSVDLSFAFNAAGEISEVQQTNTNNVQLYESDVLPEFVQARVNQALANDTPLTVTYVDEAGKPSSSMRGSTMVYSDHQLSIWARSRGGIIKSLEKNPWMSLLYRDNPTRSTLLFKGKAHVIEDDKEAGRIHDLTPEVERNHLSRATGAAIVIDLESVDGGTPEGRVRFRREVS